MRNIKSIYKEQELYNEVLFINAQINTFPNDYDNYISWRALFS